VDNKQVSQEIDSSRMTDWIKSSTSIDLDRLEWHEGEAWIPSGELPLLHSVERRSHRIEFSQIEDDLQLLGLSQSSALTPQRAAFAVKYLCNHPEALGERGVSHLLSFDEAAIRSEAVRAWLSIARDNDDEMLVRIFSDGHPRVALGVYRGLIDSWHSLPDDRRKILLLHVSNWAVSPIVAVTLLPRLSVFDRVEHTGTNPPWALFAELMPLVMSAVPAKLSFDDARFFNAVKCSLAHIDASHVVRICAVWLTWIERELKYRLPSDYELAICDILIKGTSKEPSSRATLTHQVLKINATGALITFVSDLVNAWQDLTHNERNEVLQLLAADRTDVPWLHAIALTREAVPSEIQQLVLGRSDRLGDPPSILVAEISSTLLACMVSTYAGSPQPLWWLGTQSHGNANIDGLLHVLEGMPNHPLFEIVLWKALISPSDDHLTEIIKNAGEANTKYLFKYLLRYKIQCVGNWLPKTWTTLLRAFDAAERERCYDSMAKNAPAILDDLSDVFDWLLADSDRAALVSRHPFDFEAETLILRAKRDPNITEVALQETANRLEQLARQKKPRLHGTYSSMQSFLGHHKMLDDAVGHILESGRLAALSEGRAIKDKMRLKEPTLHHWVGPK
jgi:hypothetical protein